MQVFPHLSGEVISYIEACQSVDRKSSEGNEFSTQT
jgi:hypothetical protein